MARKPLAHEVSAIPYLALCEEKLAGLQLRLKNQRAKVQMLSSLSPTCMILPFRVTVFPSED